MRKREIKIKKFVNWNGSCLGGEVSRQYIWDYQFEQVLKEYQKKYKVILEMIRK